MQQKNHNEHSEFGYLRIRTKFTSEKLFISLTMLAVSSCGNQPTFDGLMPASRSAWIANTLQKNESVFAKLNGASGLVLEVSDLQDELNSKFQLNSDFRLKQKTQSTSKSRTKWELFEYVDGNDTPLCSDNLKFISSKNMALGTIPTSQIAFVDTVSPENAFQVAQESLLRAGEVFSTSDIVLSAGRSCYALRDGEFWPAAQIEMKTLDGSLLRATATDSDMLSFERVNFDVTATLTAYDTNPNGTITDYELTGMTDSGYLENNYFTTTSADEKAYSADFIFNYPTSEPQFDEVSIFLHANRHFKWAEELGFAAYTADKINLVAHAVIGGTINNALYTPASGTYAPKIQVGDGDGLKLTNLGRDEDVVSHELGHHIVYEHMTSVIGESLVLHEGLADFLTFLRTDNACLGESICPEGSTIGCEKEAQCLRSGENDYVLDVNTKSQAHFKSQFISGMLWDLRASEFITKEEFSRLTYEAISMLLPESGYHDFIAALIIADSELHEGKNCSAFYSAAVSRGLETYISDFDCGAKTPTAELLGGESRATTVTKSSSKSSLCGVSSSSKSNTETSAAMLILTFLTLASIDTGFRALKTRKRPTTYS